jgi:hypothetical protein
MRRIAPRANPADPGFITFSPPSADRLLPASSIARSRIADDMVEK